MLMTIEKRVIRALRGAVDETRRNEPNEAIALEPVQRKTPAAQIELDDIVTVPDVTW
jgi:hypothetical protein